MMFKLIYPHIVLFWFLLIISTLILMSSSNFLIMWLSMELNMLVFIPIMSLSKEVCEMESTLLYYIIQSVGSSMLIMSIMSSQMSSIKWMSGMMMTGGILLKLGSAPMHMWFPSVVSGLSWFSVYIISTWQKVGPLMLMTIFLKDWMFVPLFLLVMANILVGTLGGLNQFHLRPLMAYSSISHMGWVFSGLFISPHLCILYFFVYCFIFLEIAYNFMMESSWFSYYSNPNTSSGAQSNISVLLGVMSLGGMPPLLGFWAKLAMLVMITKILPLMSLFMVMGSVTTLFFYFSVFMKSFLSMTSITDYLWSGKKISMAIIFLLFSL